MRISLCFAFFLLFSCSHKSSLKTGKVTIIKQWHPSASLDTTDIDASKKIPQYDNQKRIYDYLTKMLKPKKTNLLIVEGCESGTEIDSNFQIQFNGWSMTSLAKLSNDDRYGDIVTSLPMKIKAKFPEKIRALCGDNDIFLKKNLLAISDARGFIGFYLRLKEAISNPKKFAIYKQALEETQKSQIQDPIQYTKKRTKQSLEEFDLYIKKRNSIFTQIIKKNIQENPILIIGGLHTKDLIKQLKTEGIETEVITPTGYPESSEKLIDNLLNELDQ